MSIKTSYEIPRTKALEMILRELPILSSELIEKILNQIADSDESMVVSRFDDFNVVGQ